MSMCYLCDLCAHQAPLPWAFCKLNKSGHLIHPKKAIDYGRDDPKSICNHFEPKEGGDD